MTLYFVRMLAAMVVLFPALCTAQSTLKIMSYNVLNFPQGDMVDRQDTLAVILNEVQPDLLLLQELKSEAGLMQIAEESCAGLNGTYVASQWEPLQSNLNSSWPLQQGLVYNVDVLGMIEESVILTPYRDINAFRMYVKNAATLAGDTAYLNVFVTHLKSSQGSDNEDLRNQMAEAFVAALSDYNPEVPAILAGDFNLYSSTEPAYQTLLDLSNPVVFLDPIDAPGNWTESSFGMPELLTQSTRSSQIYGDGAGGGLDDRFDFALLSENLLNASAPLQYVNGSYTAYGNTGLCYNTSLPNCETDDEVPGEVTWALYHMSDHLPIVFELESTTPLAIPNQEPTDTFPRAVGVEDGLRLMIPRGSWEGSLRIFSADGRLLHEREGVLSHHERFTLDGGVQWVVLEWTSSMGERKTERVLVR